MLKVDVKNNIAEFVTTLKENPVYLGYINWINANNDDEELNELRNEYGRLRKHFTENQNNGKVTQEEINRLRELQSQINSHPIIVNLINYQNELKTLLQACNVKISENIGIDFAVTSAPSSCCG